MTNAITVEPETIKGAKELIRHYFRGNIPAFLHGKPGCAKSSIWAQVAQEEGVGFKIIRLSTKLPEDLTGIPVADLQKQMAVWLESEFWPDVKRDGERGIILFDDLSDANRTLQAASYGVILDRDHLPPGWYPAAAGNRREDRAAAQAISTALANRFAHIDVEPDLESVIEHFDKIGVHWLITGFLRWKPEAIHTMEGGTHLAFASPRSWEMASKFAEAEPNVRYRLLRGIIGPGIAGEFNAYAKLNDFPSLEDIVKAPLKTPIPAEPGSRYAISAMLARNMEINNVDRIMQYIKRDEFGADFETVTVLDATKREPGLVETKAFGDFARRRKDFRL